MLETGNLRFDLLQDEQDPTLPQLVFESRNQPKKTLVRFPSLAHSETDKHTHTQI